MFKNVIVNIFLLGFKLIVNNKLFKIECKKVYCDYFFLIKYYYYKVYVDLYKISYFYFKDLEDCIKLCKILEFLVFDKLYVFFFLFFCYYDMYKRRYCF